VNLPKQQALRKRKRKQRHEPPHAGCAGSGTSRFTRVGAKWEPTAWWWRSKESLDSIEANWPSSPSSHWRATA
jgi:hypothetical protein